MTYWHAIILIHRQAVLNNFAKISRQNRRASVSDAATQESVQKCLQAAMNTVGLIDEMSEHGQMFRAFWVNDPVSSNHSKSLTESRSRHILHSLRLW